MNEKSYDPKRQCFVCEAWTEGWFSFATVPVTGDQKLHLVICVECLSYGVKYIVMKGREAFGAK